MIYIFTRPAKTINPNDIITIGTGTLEQTIKVLGKTDLVDTQKLTFLSMGKIKKIYVKEGQKIKAWQLLAELDKKDLSNDIAQQQLNIRTAQLNYQKLFTTTTQSQLLKAQNDVEDTRRKLTQAQIDLTNLQKEKSNKLNDTVVSDNAQITNALIIGKNILIDTTNGLNDLDKILQITTKSDTKLYLWAKSPSTLWTAENAHGQMWVVVRNYETSYYALTPTSTNEQALVVLDQASKMLNQLMQVASATIDVLDNTIVTSSYPQTTIDSNRSMVNSLRSKITTNLTSINTANTQLKISPVDVARDYDTRISSKTNEIKNLQKLLTINEATDKDLKAGPKREDVSLQKNTISQYQLSLQRSASKVQDYELRATFDGVVRTIDFEAGDIVSSAQGITIENPDLIQLIALVDQIDVVKIQTNQLVRIQYDAYPDLFFTWNVVEVDPQPIEDAGVVSYQVKISTQQTDKPVYAKMSATLEILLSTKENILLVSSLALINSGGKVFVNEYISWKVIQIPIILGLSDGAMLEVLSGLTFWEKVLTKEFKFVSKQQGFSFGPPRGTGANTREKLQKASGQGN